MRRSIAFILSITLVVNSFSQLQITPGPELPYGWTPESLVRYVLLGSGVDVFNVKFNNTEELSCGAIARFTTGSITTNLGITEGIIISTGYATGADGPNDGGHYSTQPMCSTYVHPGIRAIANGRHLYDVATLEFDFIPKSTYVKFRYVFGSEEYPEYVGQDYNDVFGFFITGPNPHGGNYDNENIAIIPNSGGTPVSVATVNANSYSWYYVNNTQGAHIQYDGFTVPLIAYADVVPCSTYHVAMSICDVGDAIYDSGVFLEAESFSANTISSYVINSDNPGDLYTIHESCPGAEIKFYRPYTETVDMVYNLQIEGTAINGIDYELIDSLIYFADTTLQISLFINPINDSVFEEDETIILIYNPSPCETDTIKFTLRNSEVMQAYIDYTPPIRTDTAVSLTAMVSNGVLDSTADYRYLWSTGDTTRTIVVPTIPSEYYWFEVYDKCNGIAYSDTILIGILFDFSTHSEDTSCCPGDTVVLRVSGGDYQIWSTGDTSSTIMVVPTETTIYTVTSYKLWNNTMWEDEVMVKVEMSSVPKAQIVAKPPYVTTEELKTTLVDASVGGDTRIWILDYGTKMYDKIITYNMPFQDSAKVELISINTKKCSDTTQKIIYLLNEVIWVPRAFTPNAESNNLFYVKASTLEYYEITIYNRWGEQIFYSNDIAKSWDGTYNGNLCMKDYYVYHIRYSHINNPNEILLKTGTVLLLK